METSVGEKTVFSEDTSLKGRGTGLTPAALDLHESEGLVRLGVSHPGTGQLTDLSRRLV